MDENPYQSPTIPEEPTDVPEFVPPGPRLGWPLWFFLLSIIAGAVIAVRFCDSTGLENRLAFAISGGAFGLGNAAFLRWRMP